MAAPLPHAAAGRMTPTATYQARHYNWVRCPQLYLAAVPIDGLLALRLKKFAGGEEFDLYAVLDEGERPFEGRCLLLHNVFDAAQPEPYRVCVGPVVTCTCRSGRTHPARECKHKSAVVALLFRSQPKEGLAMAKSELKIAAIKPNLGDVILLKRDAHLMSESEAEKKDARPRWSVVEVITRTRLDGERVEYLLRTNDGFADKESVVTDAEILSIDF